MNEACIINGDYFGNTKINLNFPCEIHFTRFGNTDVKRNKENIFNKIEFNNENAYKVFICSNEPSTSKSREENISIIENSYQYDLILTTEQTVLENCPNAVFFPYGGTWLNKSNKHLDSLGEFHESILNDIKKEFNISFLTTCLLGKEGYNLRQKIWNTRNFIKIPTIFYSSTRFITTNNNFSDSIQDGLLPNDNKINLFNSQFSIAVESNKENSYFTEKLIDCLLTKTVPIYWGCDNIGNFFDIRGIIQFNTFEEMIENINKIDENTYENLKPYIEKNYELAKEYGRDFFKRIEEVIQNSYEQELQKKDILWTIGILTVPSRKSLLNKLLTHIDTNIPYRYRHRIEIIVNNDNMIKTVGQKRNEIIKDSKGKYISFIDDDDMVSFYYISKMAIILETDKYDGIGFWGIYYVSQNPIMKFNHANNNAGHFKIDGLQYRPLNHLNPVRINIAKKIGYPEKNFGEDSDYCDRLLESGLIKSEFNFNEVMYHYLFDPKTTETQK